MTTKDDEKAARLAAALRDNLKRRKQRERALDAPAKEDDVTR